MINLRQFPISTVLTITGSIIAFAMYTERVDLYDVYFNRDKIFRGREYWRLLTSLFVFGPSPTGYLILITIFLQSRTLEGEVFPGRPVDFLIYLSFGIACLWAWAYFNAMLFLGPGLLEYVMCYSAKMLPDQRVMLLPLPIPVPAPFAPYIVMGFVILLHKGAGLSDYLVAFVVAHVFFYLKDVLNTRFERDWFRASDELNAMVRRTLNFV